MTDLTDRFETRPASIENCRKFFTAIPTARPPEKPCGEPSGCRGLPHRCHKVHRRAATPASTKVSNTAGTVIWCYASQVVHSISLRRSSPCSPVAIFRNCIVPEICFIRNTEARCPRPAHHPIHRLEHPAFPLWSCLLLATSRKRRLTYLTAAHGSKADSGKPANGVLRAHAKAPGSRPARARTTAYLARPISRR